MAGEERYLWLIHYLWDGESRLWWAYFKDWSEVQEEIAILTRNFRYLGSFELQRLEVCPNGLRVLDQYYSSTCSSQQRADTWFKEMACQRDRQFFPLAPSACDYLASFLAGLGW